MNRELKNKGGRPKVNAANKKTVAITVRLTPVEYARLVSRAQKANIKPVSRFIVYSSMHNVIEQNFLRSDVDALKSIAKMGSNLNQVAHQANIFGLPSVEYAARDLMIQIKDVLQAISRRL